MLTRTQNNWYSHTLLESIKWYTIVENCLVVSYQVKHTLWPNNSNPLAFKLFPPREAYLSCIVQGFYYGLVMQVYSCLDNNLWLPKLQILPRGKTSIHHKSCYTQSRQPGNAHIQLYKTTLSVSNIWNIPRARFPGVGQGSTTQAGPPEDMQELNSIR